MRALVHKGADVGKEKIIIHKQLIGKELIGTSSAASEKVIKEENAALI